jgi:hypothetical protein
MTFLSGKFPEIGKKRVSGSARRAGGQDLIASLHDTICDFYKYIQRIAVLAPWRQKEIAVGNL